MPKSKPSEVETSPALYGPVNACPCAKCGGDKRYAGDLRGCTCLPDEPPPNWDAVGGRPISPNVTAAAINAEPPPEVQCTHANQALDEDGEWHCLSCEPPEGPAPDDSADRPIPEDAAIKAAHPTRTGRHDLYAEALRLVGARHSKSDLVDLVNWLLRTVDELRAKLAEADREIAVVSQKLSVQRTLTEAAEARVKHLEQEVRWRQAQIEGRLR